MTATLAETCLLSARPLPPYRFGRPRRYDSDECRKADHVLRKMLAAADRNERLADAGGVAGRSAEALRRDAAEWRAHVEREQERWRRAAAYAPPPEVVELLAAITRAMSGVA